MKVALAVLGDRIAPVFDTARHLEVLEVEEGRVLAQSRHQLGEDWPPQRVLRLVELGVGTLVCGAISASMYHWATNQGLKVLPFVAGDRDEVLRAWLEGRLCREAYRMPGCGQPGAFRPGPGHGGGRRAGRGPRGGGSQVALCVCPACGFRASHRCGTPCVQTLCPRCGAVMGRG